MAPINEIVQVNITRGSVSISRAGFGTIMILGGNAAFKERLQYFSDLQSVADALLNGSDAPEYKAAQAIFSQNPCCERVAIGHRGATVKVAFNGSISLGSILYSVNGVSDVQFFNNDKATTLTELAGKIAAIGGIDSATYSSGVITIVPEYGAVVGIDISLSVGPSDTLSVSYETVDTESVTDALNAINEYQNNWYGLILASRDPTDVSAAAAWVEAAELKVFVTASNDENILDAGDTTSIAHLFKQYGYFKTQVRYAAKADTEYPDAALLGRILPYDPGSYTAAFKNLAGVSVDSLTTTQRAIAFSKNVDVYEYIGGVNITRNGKVAGGEYLDVMIFIDWLKARCTEAVFEILVSNLKVPYTDAGIAAVENALTQPLKAGQNAGGISPTAYDDQKRQIGGFYITVPKAANVSSADKTARTLNNVKFVAFLAGAIHFVRIDGLVTV